MEMVPWSSVGWFTGVWFTHRRRSASTNALATRVLASALRNGALLLTPKVNNFYFFLFVILISRRSMNFISNALKLLSPCIFCHFCPFKLGPKCLLLLVCSRAQRSGILLSAGNSCHINKIVQINDYFATGLVQWLMLKWNNSQIHTEAHVKQRVGKSNAWALPLLIEQLVFIGKDRLKPEKGAWDVTSLQDQVLGRWDYS